MFSCKLIANVMTGIGTIGVLALGYAYGQYKYYSGRCDKYDELKPIIDVQQALLHQMINNAEKEES